MMNTSKKTYLVDVSIGNVEFESEIEVNNTNEILGQVQERYGHQILDLLEYDDVKVKIEIKLLKK